jgi:hypothetical protein
MTLLREAQRAPWLDRANTVSFPYARSEGHNAFYVRAGFAF